MGIFDWLQRAKKSSDTSTTGGDIAKARAVDEGDPTRTVVSDDPNTPTTESPAGGGAGGAV